MESIVCNLCDQKIVTESAALIAHANDCKPVRCAICGILYTENDHIVKNIPGILDGLAHVMCHFAHLIEQQENARQVALFRQGMIHRSNI